MSQLWFSCVRLRTLPPSEIVSVYIQLSAKSHFVNLERQNRFPQTVAHFREKKRFKLTPTRGQKRRNWKSCEWWGQSQVSITELKAWLNRVEFALYYASKSRSGFCTALSKWTFKVMPWRQDRSDPACDLKVIQSYQAISIRAVAICSPCEGILIALFI